MIKKFIVIGSIFVIGAFSLGMASKLVVKKELSQTIENVQIENNDLTEKIEDTEVSSSPASSKVSHDEIYNYITEISKSVKLSEEEKAALEEESIEFEADKDVIYEQALGNKLFTLAAEHFNITFEEAVDLYAENEREQ